MSPRINLLVAIFVSATLGYSIGNTALIYSAISFRNAITHDYDYDHYNCVNFTEALAQDLYAVGADARKVHGFLKKECVDWSSIPDQEYEDYNRYWLRHEWIRVVFDDGVYFDFEAVTGLGISPELFNRCYRVEWVE